MNPSKLISSQNGLLSSILSYNSINHVVKQQVFSYGSQLKDTITGYILCPTGVPLGAIDYCNLDSSGINYKPLLLRKYEITSDWWKLNSETTTEFTGNGNNITQTTNYVYNTQNYLPKEITTTGSRNDPVKQIIRYPDEYSSYAGMVSKHLVNLPVENLSLVNNSVVKAVKTDYKDTLNTYLPKTILALNTTAPLPANSYAQHYVSEVTFDKYDSKGKVLQLSTRNGDKIVYLWGYNHQYPIAEIRNVTYSDVCKASGIGNGNETTGKNKLTTIAGKSVPATADFTAINNLRTYLPNAQVTTYKYKPLVGVTTVTDPSGKTVTYEYDVFGRLYRIKDLTGKTLEQYEYHYKN